MHRLSEADEPLLRDLSQTHHLSPLENEVYWTTKISPTTQIYSFINHSPPTDRPDMSPTLLSPTPMWNLKEYGVGKNTETYVEQITHSKTKSEEKTAAATLTTTVQPPRPLSNISLRVTTKTRPLKPTPCSQSGKCSMLPVPVHRLGSHDVTI